ncbi:Allergen [Penicillium diatomitis]|uniref:Allergen n=1 Tax=Penicillium diatomitis TaxID=2819901 RepID=A0A9W9XGM6_9EURO|nr:Allergen [Penicillium diatomitis]KAJ5492636.1 Allergen [Penicillium diatomitis]
MLVKNSLLLAAALTAGSAAARMHGHERRHAHHKAQMEPIVEVEKRAVGDVVHAVIDGVLQTWINEWSGESATSSATTFAVATSAPTTIVSVPTITAAPTHSQAPSAIESMVPAHTATPGSSGSWSDLPANGQYTRAGFGVNNCDKSQDGALGVMWSGNTGLPWGSNIIEVEENVANQYKHVVRFEGSESDDWTVVVWNKKGPDGKMDGFFHPNKALTFTVGAGQVKYVAIDTDSTGGWAAWKGDEMPLSQYGSYAATWGEFTMRDSPNFTSWDVSCIQAQNAGKEIQGMRICQHDGSTCSTITKNMGTVQDAYTSAETDINGIGGNVKVEAIRLVVNLDYA